MSDEQIKSLGKAITRQHAVAEQLAARVMQMDEVNAELLEFAQEVRRAGDTRLASMAIAAIARAESAIETPAKVSPCAGHAAQQDADESCAHRFVRDEEAPRHLCCQACGEVKNEADEAGGA